MLYFAGMICVLWTTIELVRLIRAANVTTISFEEALAAANRCGKTPPQRFAAWDEDGRVIEVEDLGAR